MSEFVWPTVPVSQFSQWWDVWQWVFYMAGVEILVIAISHTVARLTYRVVNIPQTALIRSGFELLDRMLPGDQGTWGARADRAIDVSLVWILTFAIHGLLSLLTLCCQVTFLFNLLSRVSVPYTG